MPDGTKADVRIVVKPREFRRLSDIAQMCKMDSWCSPERIQEHAELPQGQIRVYTLKAEPAGIVGYLWYLSSNKVLQLVRVYVREEYRRRGVGVQIVNTLKAKLNSNRQKLIAKVPEANLAMQLLLKRCGMLCFQIEYDSNTNRELYVFEYHYAE